MNWLQRYGFSDCVFCDIVAHQPWEPATFVYEDEEVAVFHNVLGWIPVMLLAVPRRRLKDPQAGADRHYEQRDLWRKMGRLGAIAMAIGRAHCQVDGVARFRLVSNFGSLALQSQSHAHVHVLGAEFQPSFPDIRCTGSLVHDGLEVRAYREDLDSGAVRGALKALMVVPRETITQDEFFANMDCYGPTVLDLAESQIGESFRLLAEVGPHAPISHDGAHLFVLGGSRLGHYV